MINLKVLPVGSVQVNCYILKSEKDGIIIDPGGDASLINNEIHGLKIKYILLTHLHFDHVDALEEIQKQTKAKVGFNKNDLSAKEDSFIRTDFVEKKPNITSLLKEGDFIPFGDKKIEVLETPGHTPGSISFYIKDSGMFFSGDTIFKNGVGRTDLPCSNHKDLKNSIKKIFNLPEETKIYPGHGEKTTVESEKKNFI